MELNYRLVSVVGLAFLVFVTYLISENKRAIKYRTVLVGILLQFTIGWLLLKSSFAQPFFQGANDIMVKVLSFSGEGANFVFGSLMNTGGFVFAISIGATIIFVGSLTAVLYHLGIIQVVIKFIGKIMSKIMGVSGAESFVCTANVFVGMTEAPLVIRPYLAKLTRSEVMAMLTGGLATVSGGVMAVFAGIGISPGHLLTASFMSAPAALVIAKILVPEVSKPTDATLSFHKESENIIDAACKGATDGLKLAANVIGVLIAIVALVALFNYMVGAIGGWFSIDNLTLQKILSYPFAPIAWLVGVPAEDMLKVGELLGQKIVLNEFIAYVDLSKIKDTLSPRAVTVATYALCGFANIGSIAIQLGGISALVPSRRRDLATLSLKALYGGTVAALMTAAIASILI